MNTKEKAPSAATLEAAGMETAAFGEAAISSGYFITSGPNGQAGKLWNILPAGETLAVPAADLAELAGYSNTRALRLAVDRLRSKGVPVLACQNGYFRPSPGPAGIAEVRRFLRRQDSRAASNRKTTSLIRARLRELERGPLDGQESLFVGGGGDDRQ